MGNRCVCQHEGQLIGLALPTESESAQPSLAGARVSSAALEAMCFRERLGGDLAYLATEVRMADNQKAKHGDSQSGQKNDQKQGNQGRSDKR